MENKKKSKIWKKIGDFAFTVVAILALIIIWGIIIPIMIFGAIIIRLIVDVVMSPIKTVKDCMRIIKNKVKKQRNKNEKHYLNQSKILDQEQESVRQIGFMAKFD